MNIKTHLDKLGRQGEDRVTGFKGVVASVFFDLYGCIQVILTPPVGKDGKKLESLGFDVSRIKVTAGKPVMERPDWDFGPMAEGRHGPAEKPAITI